MNKVKDVARRQSARPVFRLARLRLTLALAVTLLGVVVVQPRTSIALKGSTTMARQQQQEYGRVRAPELTGGRDWLNTDTPLSLAALRGKVVLLDFWTYGCINCIHIIPDLKRLEAKYGNQLVVIGVHSAKFDNEKETENIRRIILRYEVEHPVVNDADFKIWRSYAVRAWPTQMLIDPAGYVVGKVEGEGNYETIDRSIGRLVEDFRKRGALNEQPLKLALERAKVGDLPLAFPGKILADERGDRLFIADSNHNRIVVTRLDGTLVETIGTGERGRADGALAEATFDRPQGMALDGDALYVADTENHLIRRVDLKTRTVSTVAGTGQQQSEYLPTGGAPSRTSALNSPWDLLVAGDALYIAMAGPHQIWKLDLKKERISVFAGSGREARLDGSRDESAFAQPSGLATDGKTLFVADSESNIIRAIDLSAGGEVKTLVGGDLFEFGDADGRGDDVRLQHPLGVVFNDGAVLIADTYNHKIKRLDPRSRSVKTVAGTGKPGQTDGKSAAFYEPGGISIASGRLYVADTNNHAVRVLDLKTGQASTLAIRGLQPPAQNIKSQEADASNTNAPNSEEIKLAPQRLRLATDGALVVDVALPEGYHLNPSAPQRYRVSVEDGAEHVGLEAATVASSSATAVSSASTAKDKSVSRASKDLKLPLRVPLHTFAAGKSELRIQLTIFYCREDNTGTCRIKTLVWRAPVEVTADQTAPLEIKAQGQIKGE